MSASSKKKLRKEQDVATLTERQRAELAEAKKTKAYTIGFVVVIALLVVVAAFSMIRSAITGNGIMEKKTVAATVSNHDISNAELSYYFVDSVNNYYQDLHENYGQNANMYSQIFYGVDLSKALDTQQFSEEMTWGDYFVQEALSSARSVYTLVDAANKAGVTLTSEEESSIDMKMTYMQASGATGNYPDLASFLKAIYGAGATEESFREYTRMNLLANKYFNEYAGSLTYTDADLRAKEAENYNYFTAYTANYYYVSFGSFLEGGTTDENGSTTYSDEENAAALAAAEEAANALAAQKFETVADFDAAIAAMPINSESEGASSTVIKHQMYANLSSLMQGWLSDSSRQYGDVTVIPNESTNADGETTTNGYYVVFFVDADENLAPTSSVRHLLVAFEGGTLDENGKKIYSDSEKSAAKLEAEKLLKKWKDGEATEESFAALVTENTDDTASAESGGLFENISPDSSYAENFLNWAIDESRQVGDVDIVETEFGYHVMYFVGHSDMSYRDTMITNVLRNEQVQAWYNDMMDANPITEKDTSYIDRSLSLNVS